MKKIFLFLLILLCFSNTQALKLVSIGDSIPNGYLLEDENESYDNMFAKTLNMVFYEHSYIGMTTKDLLVDLSDEKLIKNIKEADLIFLNVGPNDLLDLITESDYDFSISGDNLVNEANALINYVYSDLEMRIPIVRSRFIENWPQIINTIKKYNPNAKIYVNNIYNPYFGLIIPIKGVDISKLFNLFEETIVSFNEIISGYDDYEIIDVYSILRKGKYLNINLLERNFDPHPNREGHQRIYEEYLKQLCYKVTYQDQIYYVLKGGKLDIEPAHKSFYLFKKWNHDINHITSDVELKEIYIINYKILYYLVPLVIIIIFIFIKIKNRH